jgi:hypothetical protein
MPIYARADLEALGADHRDIAGFKRPPDRYLRGILTGREKAKVNLLALRTAE